MVVFIWRRLVWLVVLVQHVIVMCTTAKCHGKAENRVLKRVGGKIIIMKKITALFLLFVIALNSNSFAQSGNESGNQSKNGGVVQQKKIKVKVRFRWDGVGGPDNPCYSPSPCGMCFGICVLIEFRKGDTMLSKSEIDAGDGYAEIIYDDVNNKLIFIADGKMDDGRGLVTIKGDYSIGTEVSSLISSKQLIIKPGDYKIDYSISNETFGRVVFDLK